MSATDEIERLEQLCAARQSHLAEGGRIINELTAEIERLRADWPKQCVYCGDLKALRAATIEECAKPLEQIRQVCADNAGEGSNHKMALDFVHQIAIRALREQK